MEKMKMQTNNKANENYTKLKKLFPNAVTETIAGYDLEGKPIIERAIDKDVLMQDISTHVVEGREERYQVTWPDKKKAILTANAPISATLRPVREESVGKDGTPSGWDSQNLYIEGDNLDVLKLLQEAYLGKIKMIYIDPPFNTGKDFIYSDRYEESIDDYLIRSGQFDEYGNQIEQNLKSEGRFHTNWLNMMYSRLKLAKNVLTDDGVIFIHIDEGEVFNLKKIADDVFSPGCFINMITVKTKVAGVSGSYMGKSLQNNTEFILMYCRDNNQFMIDHLPIKRQELMKFIKEYEEEGKSWKYTSVLKSTGERTFVKSIQAGNGDEIKIYKHTGYETVSINKVAENEFKGDVKKAYYHYINSVYRTTNAQTSIRTRIIEETKDIDEDLISIDYVPIKGKNQGTVTTIYYKDAVRNMVAFLKEVVSVEDDGIFKLDQAGNFWDDINNNNLANESSIVFSNGQKPVDLLKRLIGMFDVKEKFTVLDFFSGSASTAHAVMQLNAEDGAKRRFIMVQIPEETDVKSDAHKAGYKNICDIGKARIREAGRKIKDSFGLNAVDLDIGFRDLKVDTSNMQDVYYNPDSMTKDLLGETVDNIKIDRSSEDLLFQVMLDLGIDLSSTIEEKTIDGKKVFVVKPDGIDKEYLIACFDQGVTSETVIAIAKLKPYYAVFRDSGMTSDSVATNFDQIFNTYSPQTERKVL